jgi:hypothetical protein
VYVEYWGRDDAEYVESRQYKEGVYRRRGIVPLGLEMDDVDTRAFEAAILARINRAGG